MNETSLSALLPPLRLMVLGYGHVARAFLPLLASRSEWMGRELGLRPVISGLGSRREGLYIHPAGVNAHQLVDDLGGQDALHRFRREGTQAANVDDFIEAGKAAGASLFIELTSLNPLDGQPALSYIRKALELGLDVITANKGPVAYAQSELQALAWRQGVQFRFESTVMDGLPLLNLAEFTLPAVEIHGFRAILNSTSSVVLSMVEQGYSHEEALLKAQQMGITEADPSFDLDGWDAAMKTTILANSLLEAHMSPRMVEREGIRHLTSDDICAAALAGSPYRLVSEVRHAQGVIRAEVRPRRIHADDILHSATGLGGIISLETEAMGIITVVEHANSVTQTAYGVLSDLIIIQRARSANSPHGGPTYGDGSEQH
jgi:homoserine dehydrogenase